MTHTKETLKDKLQRGDLHDALTRIGYHVLKNVSNCNRKDDMLTIGKEGQVKVYQGDVTEKETVTKTVVVGETVTSYTKEIYPDTGEGFSPAPATMGMVDSYAEGTREYFLSQEDKEDIIQDALYKLYSKLDDILQSVEEYCMAKELPLEDKSIIRYFGNMVRYAAIDYARVKRLPSVPYAQLAQRDVGQVPAIFDDILNRQYLKEVLSEEEHAVVTRYLAGYLQKDIIATLKTYKMKVHRIEKKANKALTEHMKEEILHAVINANYKVFKEDKHDKRDKLVIPFKYARIAHA